MHQMEILGYIGALLIGLILGLIGSGGSVLAVPIFIYLFLLDEKIATAYSLFVVGSTSLVGSLSYNKKKLINWNQVLLFGVPSVISVVLVRNFLMPYIPEVITSISGYNVSRRTLILGLFSILLILSSIMMFNDKKSKPSGRDLNYLKITSEGFLVGALTGLIGAGGGFLIIPSLVILGRSACKIMILWPLLKVEVVMDLIDSFSGKSLKWHLASKDVLLVPLIMRCMSGLL